MSGQISRLEGLEVTKPTLLRPSFPRSSARQSLVRYLPRYTSIAARTYDSSLFQTAMHDSQPSHQDKMDHIYLQPIVYPIRLPQELIDLVIDHPLSSRGRPPRVPALGELRRGALPLAAGRKCLHGLLRGLRGGPVPHSPGRSSSEITLCGDGYSSRREVGPC